MVAKFSEIRTVEARALQIWQILLGCAHNRQTITYQQLGRLLGYRGVGGIGKSLNPIMRYCAQNDLPPLTVLVVGKYVGEPGAGLSLKADVDSERERVYEHPWYDLCPPTMDELADANSRGMS